MKLIQKVIMCTISLLLMGVVSVFADNATYTGIVDYAVGAFEASSIDMVGFISVDNGSILFNCTILPDDQRRSRGYDSVIHNRGGLMIAVLEVAELVERKYPDNIGGAIILIRDPDGALVAYANFAAFNNTISS
jgi:hypothetical protein